MQIKSIIERKNGHSVDLDGVTYEFLPSGNPPYVADVTNEAHIARLLAIPEGYKVLLVEGQAAPVLPVTPAEPKQEQIILLGSDVHPSAFEIHGKEYSLGEIVQRAFESFDANHQAWNLLDEGERADLIDAELNKLEEAGPVNPADTNGDGVVDASEERAALVAQYEAKFGKKPHHKAGIEKIRAELEAAQ
jgi:hypothetical protein